MQDWNDIVHSHTADVLNAAYRILGNVTDAEDVTQEVFVEAFRKWDANSNQRWPGLLKRLAVCRAIDLIRKRKALKPLSTAMGDPKSACPAEISELKELQERLRVEAGNLPEREAQVFCLIYFERLNTREASELLGISISAVTTAISKARAKLQKIFLETTQGELK